MSAAANQAFAERKKQVPDDFNVVASSYDLLTNMNPGYNKNLRQSARRLRLPAGARILDLCCGTGQSTDALVKTYPDAEIVGLDASAGMLKKARTKSRLRGVDFVHGNAMAPRAAGVEGHFDGILMAYGIRNMPDPDVALSAILDLLKPGGRVCFHEYSVNDSPVSKAIWNAITCGVIIPFGFVTSPSSDIYRYLRRSVLEFDGASAFERRLAGAGFEKVHTLPMSGWQRGIVHSFLAARPKDSE